MLKKSKRARPQQVEIQATKPTNGHLTLKESKRTIVLSWGKYSVTVLCLTAIAIALIQKIRF